MTRRVTMHKSQSVDRDDLVVLTVYEPGINKESVKKINKYSKRHYVLVPDKENYEWL